MTDPDNPWGESLLQQVERILAHNIPDVVARRAVAMTVEAHIRSEYVRVLRDIIEPYTDAAVPLTAEKAVQLLRSLIPRVAGYLSTGDDGS